MKTFHFNYTVVPASSYENADFWIDIRNQHTDVVAESVADALSAFTEIIDREYCISISKNALKNASAMYRDDESGMQVQIGVVVKGKTEIEMRDYEYKQRYVDVWCSIRESVIPDFTGICKDTL